MTDLERLWGEMLYQKTAMFSGLSVGRTWRMYAFASVRLEDGQVETWNRGVDLEILHLTEIPETDLEPVNYKVKVKRLDTGEIGFVLASVLDPGSQPAPKEPVDVATQWVEQALQRAGLPKNKRQVGKERGSRNLVWPSKKEPAYEEVQDALRKHPKMDRGTYNWETTVVGRKNSYDFTIMVMKGFGGEVSMIHVESKRS